MPFSSCHDISTQFCFNPPGESEPLRIDHSHAAHLKGLEGFATAMAVRQAPWRWNFRSNGILISDGLVVSCGQRLRPKVFTCGRFVSWCSHWDTRIGIIWYHEYVGMWGCYRYLRTLLACLRRIYSNYSQIKPWREEMTIWLQLLVRKSNDDMMWCWDDTKHSETVLS